MFVVVTRSTVVALLLCFALSWRIAESSNAKGAGSAGSGLFAHERAMAEAKSILQMLGVKNPSEAQLQEMTETVKTTGLTLEDLKQAQVSDG
jgi:hypothetical protein